MERGKPKGTGEGVDARPAPPRAARRARKDRSWVRGHYFETGPFSWPEPYLAKCLDVAGALWKLPVDGYAKHFVGMEVELGCWSAFWHYGLVDDVDYLRLAGLMPRDLPERRLRRAALVAIWDTTRYPFLSPRGFARLRLRSYAFARHLGIADHNHNAAFSGRNIRECADVLGWAREHRPDDAGLHATLAAFLAADRRWRSGEITEATRLCITGRPHGRARPCVVCAHPLPRSVVEG